MTNIEITKNILKKEFISKEEIIHLLSITKKDELDILYKKAYNIKKKNVGTDVYFRGIIEFSNICIKNCFYCGIRKDNHKLKRFSMNENEILKSAKWAWESGYGSIVLQSGERTDNNFILFVENILKKIKKISNNELGITISLGEQSIETYKRWFDAGAHRYLIRIESTNQTLYKSLHPNDHDFEKRMKSIKNLRKVGYQVGTGVMIGIPNQTISDLAKDIIFYKENDIDMIGMGPYIPHQDTPMANSFKNFEEIKDKQLELALNMIAVTRIYLKDVNIASTTALQALNSIGREMGLSAGANIIMPNITDTKYREGYQLYDSKPCLDENSTMCRGCLESRIKNIGETIGYNKWGDSPHFIKKNS